MQCSGYDSDDGEESKLLHIPSAEQVRCVKKNSLTGHVLMKKKEDRARIERLTFDHF